MKVLLFTCAQGLSLDFRQTTASLFHIIEEVTASAFPSILPPFTLYALIQKEAGDAESSGIKLKITLDREILSENELAVTFAGKPRTHLTGELQGFMVPRAGTLNFSLMKEETEIGRWAIPVLEPPVDSPQAKA